MAGTLFHDFAGLVTALLDLYLILILVRALMSWFVRDPRNKVYQFLARITEPVLSPIRRIMPRMAVDLSPVVAMLLIQILISIIKKIT
jgi:YggT family protein